MKTINNKLIVVGLLIIGLATAAQAQATFWTNNSHNFVLKALLMPTAGNKYCPNANSPLTDAEIDAALRSHNETRQAVGTPPLKWNCALAEFAQKWANKDTGEHSPDKDRQDLIQGSLAGENLSQDSEPNQTVQKMIQGWIDEKPFMNSDNKTCVAGKVCGHYTQMVWRNSTELGCGIFRQSNAMPDADSKGKANYLVCIYNPGGNDGTAAF